MHLSCSPNFPRASYRDERTLTYESIENKWVDNPRITIVECVGAHPLRWKNALNYDYKNNNSRNFQFTKFLSIDFVLNDKRSLSGKRPKSARSKSSSCRFSFSAARNANTKANEYLTFGFYLNIGFLPLEEKFEPHCLSTMRIFKCHISRKFRQITCIENREGFAVHSSTWKPEIPV